MPPPNYTGLLKLLYDWQTIITGGLAIVAAIIGAGAAYHVGNIQLAAAKHKDRLQALCIAVGISPELLQLEVALGKAQTAVDQLPTVKNQIALVIVSHIRSAQIDIPPILNRNVDQLYILGEPAGPTVLQLLSGTLQYNRTIETLARQIEQRVDMFNPPEHQRDLAQHLTRIHRLIADAQREIGRYNDEATRHA